MPRSFIAYAEWLELEFFFSGFLAAVALLYLLNSRFGHRLFTKRNGAGLFSRSYALAGLLFLGLQLKNLYPDYSFENIMEATHYPFLKIWALGTILFFIPFFHRFYLVLPHSVVFFSLMLKDLYTQSWANPDRDLRNNDLKILFTSIAFHLLAFAFIKLTSLLITYLKRVKNSRLIY